VTRCDQRLADDLEDDLEDGLELDFFPGAERALRDLVFPDALRVDLRAVAFVVRAVLRASAISDSMLFSD
jgi:hypothetical protein